VCVFDLAKSGVHNNETEKKQEKSLNCSNYHLTDAETLTLQQAVYI